MANKKKQGTKHQWTSPYTLHRHCRVASALPPLPNAANGSSTTISKAMSCDLEVFFQYIAGHALHQVIIEQPNMFGIGPRLILLFQSTTGKMRKLTNIGLHLSAVRSSYAILIRSHCSYDD